jgi:hypothetical protein
MDHKRRYSSELFRIKVLFNLCDIISILFVIILFVIFVGELQRNKKLLHKNLSDMLCGSEGVIERRRGRDA